MTAASLTQKDLLDIVELVGATETIQDFRLCCGDVEISLSKSGGNSWAAVEASAASPAVIARVAQAPVVQPSVPAVADGVSAEKESQSALPPDAIAIKSPTVGTFYAAKEPGAAPFVEVGQTIAANTTVCIVEVMKVMNTVQANVAGTVIRILATDGQPVEFNQPLMYIKPV